MALRRWIGRRYTRLLEAQRCAHGFPGPTRNLRWYNEFASYFRNEIVYRMCVAAGARRVLIVGDGGGRDYWYLRWKGFGGLTVVDIAPQFSIPSLVQGDIAGRLPFADGTFDCAIACDVLEHLYDDREALRNLHALLCAGGVLVIAGPYWHDADRTHVRIHSPEIIRRTLEDSGFVVEAQLSRGGLAHLMRLLHALNVVVNLVSFSVAGRILFDRINRMSFALNRPITRWRGLPHVERACFGMARGLNGYVIQARRADGPIPDVKKMNREKFTNMSPEALWHRS